MMGIETVIKCTCDKCKEMTEMPPELQIYHYLMRLGWRVEHDENFEIVLACPKCLACNHDEERDE